MSREAAIHVVSRSRDGLFRALARDLAGLVQVHAWHSIPAPDHVEATDLILVDLVDLPEGLDADAFMPLLERATLWLVTGDDPVAAAWVDLAARSATRVVASGAGERGASGRFAPVVRLLQDELARQTGRRLARLVLEHEPLFRSVEPLVELVCQHPWRVRRPKDLAAITGQRIEQLKQVLGRLGFRRVEHFIVTVRMVGFEQLMARQRLPLPVARRLVGIGDPSNTRRQLERARRRSGEAFLKLRSLVA